MACDAPQRQRLLQRLALRVVALLLLAVASCRGSEFLEGDFIPAARRAQFHGVRRCRCRHADACCPSWSQLTIDGSANLHCW